VDKKERRGETEERASSREGRSMNSIGSIRGNSRGSSEGGVSVGSSSSTREVEKTKRWVINRDRENRRKNMIIKEIKIPREVGNDRKKGINWVTDLIKEKLCVDAKIVACRESGTVIMVKMENEEEKREVMRNKFRLKEKVCILRMI